MDGRLLALPAGGCGLPKRLDRQTWSTSPQEVNIRPCDASLLSFLDDQNSVLEDQKSSQNSATTPPKKYRRGNRTQRALLDPAPDQCLLPPGDQQPRAGVPTLRNDESSTLQTHQCQVHQRLPSLSPSPLPEPQQPQRQTHARSKLADSDVDFLRQSSEAHAKWVSELRQRTITAVELAELEKHASAVVLADPYKVRTEMCKDALKGVPCEAGLACTYAHSPSELQPRFRTETYKSQPCSDVARGGALACRFGSSCNFVHPVEPCRLPFFHRAHSLKPRPGVRSEYLDVDYYSAVREAFPGDDCPYGLYL